jgi:hypothetical protein
MAMASLLAVLVRMAPRVGGALDGDDRRSHGVDGDGARVGAGERRGGVGGVGSERD